MDIPDNLRITLFVDHPGNESPDFDFVDSWIKKWGNGITVANHSSGGWEHLWNIEAPWKAIAEIPKRFFCHSDWTTYPSGNDFVNDPRWDGHFDDGLE
jgi:hypothetical protein